MARKEFFLCIFFILLVFDFSFVSAFSVATIYSEGYPLKIRPGESKETFFLLRNVVEGDSDAVIKSELFKGQEIASLPEGSKTYDVPFGAEIEVPVKIEIPKDAELGSTYKVAAIFKPIVEEGEGQGNIQFIVNIGKSFPVVVVAEEEKKKPSGENFQLTVDDEPQDIVSKLAPALKGKGVLWGIIFVFILAICVIMVLIVVLLRRSSVERYVQGNSNYYPTAEA